MKLLTAEQIRNTEWTAEKVALHLRRARLIDDVRMEDMVAIGALDEQMLKAIEDGVEMENYTTLLRIYIGIFELARMQKRKLVRLATKDPNNPEAIMYRDHLGNIITVVPESSSIAG